MKRLLPLLLCAVFLLAACGGAPPASPAPSAPEASVPEAAPAAPAAENALRPLRQGNEDGYYYTVSANYTTVPGDARLLLHYLDYANMRDIVLCPNPGCAHDGEACPAFADMTVLNAPCVAGDHLVDFCGPWDGTPPQIVVTNLDGTNRRVVHTLASGQLFGSPVGNRRGGSLSPYFWDGAFVYFPVAITVYGSQAGPDGFPLASSITGELRRLDPATGEVTKVLDLAVDSLVEDMSYAAGGDYIFGALGREVLVKHYTGDYTAFTFTAIDVDTGARRDIAGWDLPGNTYTGTLEGETRGENLAQVLDGKIYLPDWQRMAYLTIDPATGAETLTQARLDDLCLTNFLEPIRAFVDGWLLVDEPVARPSPDDPDAFVIDALHYAVRPDTGERRELTAGTMELETFRPFPVLDVVDGEVLTYYVASDARVPEQQPDGSVTMARSMVRYYALIPIGSLLDNDQSALRELWPLEAA